jgi:hypothetical protein
LLQCSNLNSSTGSAQGKTRTLESTLQLALLGPPACVSAHTKQAPCVQAPFQAHTQVLLQRQRPDLIHLAQRPFWSRHTVFMEFLSLLFILATGIHWLNTQGQRKRTALLAEQLRPYQIEKHMEQLSSAYMRALGESEPERQQQILQLQEAAEQQLANEFQNLAREFAKLPAPVTRAFKLALPFIDQFSPKATFDMRRMLEVHAQGITLAVSNPQGLPSKERSFRMMGEMFLMQHSCHWFCKSKTIASARMLAQHQTRYEQALAAVSPETREAYLDVVQA